MDDNDDDHLDSLRRERPNLPLRMMRVGLETFACFLAHNTTQQHLARLGQMLTARLGCSVWLA
jgi:hypothetical protein